MADAKFFRNTGPYSLSAILSATQSYCMEGAGSFDKKFNDVGPLHTATAEIISFLDNVKYKDILATTKAGACFVSEAFAENVPKGTTALISAAPYKSYALAAQMFYPDEVLPPSDISDRAEIHDSAMVGNHCVIEAGAVIGSNVVIGNRCRIGANASISHSLIGDDVHIYPGARIGQDGFGFAIDPGEHVKVPQLGRVIIEDHVVIGANSCIDRGAGPDTIIGQGTWIDNLVQIGHNVRIGRGCVIVSQVGISGSTVLEDYAVIGGQAGIAGHLRVGKGARIGAQSGVMRDVPAGEEQMGSPAQSKKSFFRQIAQLNRLTKKAKN